MKSKIRSKEFLNKTPTPKAHRTERSEIPVSDRARKLFSFSFVLIGLICLLFTEHVHGALPYILGCAMTALGVIDTIRGFLTKEHTRLDTKLTSNGIVSLLLGIVILLNHSNADNLIGAIWGTLGLLNGSEELNEAIYCCSHKERFIGKMFRAAIELLLGLLLLTDPTANIRHHLAILGLELIVAGWETWHDTSKTAEDAPEK